MDGISATFIVSSNNAMFVAGALEALVALVSLAPFAFFMEQVVGPEAFGVELDGLLSLAIRLPFDASLVSVLAGSRGQNDV